jgi:hypothetical protein
MTTWAWIKETGRKPNGREEKRIILSVVLDQGWQKRLRKTKGHCYANQSHDVDSRKITLSVVLDQGQQKRLRGTKGIVMQTKS